MNLPFLCSTSAQLPRGGRRWAGRRPSPGPLVAPRAHLSISIWEMRETSQIRFHNKTIISSSAEKLLLVVSKGSNTRAGFLNHMRRRPGVAAHADTGVRPPAALLRAPAKLPSRTHESRFKSRPSSHTSAHPAHSCTLCSWPMVHFRAYTILTLCIQRHSDIEMDKNKSTFSRNPIYHIFFYNADR